MRLAKSLSLALACTLALIAGGCPESSDVIQVPGGDCWSAVRDWELELDSSGGLTGRGARGHSLEHGALSIADPWPHGLQCMRDLTPGELATLYAAAAAVDWDHQQPEYFPPGNPTCCCDQFQYRLVGTIVWCDGSTPVDTAWCDQSIDDGLLPQPLLDFLGLIRRLGDQVAAGC